MATVKLTELFPARFRGAIVRLTESTLRTADYTLEYEDRGKVVPVNAPGTVTITVPAHVDMPFPLGTLINIYNASPTQVLEVVGAGGVSLVTLGSILSPQSEISLRKRDLDEWVVAGVLA